MREKKSNFRNQLIIIIGILAVGAVVLFAVVSLLGDGDGDTEIVLRNSGECPELIMVLRAQDNSENITLRAKPGETDRASVQPSVVYSYELTSNNELEGGGCVFSDTPGATNIDTGEVVLPAGSTQTFNVPSVRSTDETEESDS